MGKQLNDNQELSDWTFEDAMAFVGADEYALAAQSPGAADSLATEQHLIVSQSYTNKLGGGAGDHHWLVPYGAADRPS